ncbi:MAG: hypothetical protein COV44_04875 [Deltaproteobacteria bacterium CG11_big_fil_rev_8_21_14_0_20_45_16]|nr:MAG: hypothetical protein COV44_04875 [Deltaproteobacteria bacterium CG11_big_fil_rev_8_21_14_0_20_45_16]
MSSVDIYSYLNYRDFCRDFYVFRKKTDSNFSYRYFARKAEVAPAYLKHVIDGKRNLSPEMSVRFGYGMDLSEKEVEYFENLVRFNQATSLEDKTTYLERLRRKRTRSLRSLSMAEAALLLSHWYVVAIKELVVNLNTIEVERIQAALRRKLPEGLIERTLEDLMTMGWLEQVDGQWRSQVSQIKFPDEVKSYVVRSFHRQMLELAQEALEDELDRREFGAAVFSFPTHRYPELKSKIKELQAELVSYVQDITDSHIRENSADVQKIYFFGVQCFSLQNEESK